jgi:hypothetical protein
MAKARIDAQDLRIAKVGQIFIDGNNVIGNLIAKMTPPPPTGTCSDLQSSLALYNVGQFPADANQAPLGKTFNGFLKPTAPASATKFRTPGNVSFYPWGSVQAEAARLVPVCPCLNEKPCDCGPVPKARVSPVVAAITTLTKKPTPVTITAAPVAPTVKKCRTDNICRDIRSGCVNQDQVSKAQLLACTQAGWAGTWGVFGPVINGQYLGDVDLSPAAPGPDDTFGKRFEIAQRFGLSGVVTDLSQSGVFWACLGVGVVAWMYVSEHVKRHR